MKKLIESIFKYGAFIFGLGFMAPLITQIIVRSGLALPMGLSPLLIGLVLGGGLGLLAQIRGSWIWQK